MGRKRLITDSYPVVKRREGPTGHSKGELASELEKEPQAPDVDEAELELLRQFDLAWQYGPCTGITRLQRWHRAQQMGLDPPPEVHQPLASLSTLRHCLGPPTFSRSASHPRASGKMENRLNLEVSAAQSLHLTSSLQEALLEPTHLKLRFFWIENSLQRQEPVYDPVATSIPDLNTGVPGDCVANQAQLWQNQTQVDDPGGRDAFPT
ncbi:DNA polymerase delta subunit 4 isoform X1 [Tamandua tetradactyla]|uniref:DNA polymerase delta subunit 4 isoform X1 n=1 Tax=Tamandua tetradactyla TaxID=48850 RepID=UPI0040549F11